MIKIELYLKGSLEAVKLYQKAFGFELGYHVLNSDGNGYFHSELGKNGPPQLSVVEAPEHPAGNPVQLGVTFDSREDLERALSLLAEEGTVTMEPRELPWAPWAAKVVDRFGVNWYLSLP